MAIAWIMGGIFVFMTLLFCAIAFFLPEWVGITGKKAQQTMKEHMGETDHDSKPASSPPSQTQN